MCYEEGQRGSWAWLMNQADSGLLGTWPRDRNLVQPYWLLCVGLVMLKTQDMAGHPGTAGYVPPPPPGSQEHQERASEAVQTTLES